MSFLELALVAQVLLWLIILAVFLASGQASIFHPLTIYLGFHGVVFVLRPVLVHYFNFDTVFTYMLINPSEQDFIKTLAVSSAALVVFSVSCFVAGRTHVHRSMPEPPPFKIEQKGALIVTTLLLAPVVAYSIVCGFTGGITGEERGAVYVMTGASGYTAEAQSMAGPLICAWFAVTRFSRIGLVPLILYVGYRSYCGWSRWTIVLLFVALALVYAWQKRIRWLPLWAVLLAIPAYLLFHTLGGNRDYVQMLFTGEAIEETNASMTQQDKAKVKYDTQEFANFDYLCHIVRTVPDRTGTYTYGTQYLQLFTEPIPRKLWPGKPIGAPLALVNLNKYGNFMGLTPSLPGDGWMSGGWVGLIITMGLVGGLLGKAHRWFWTHSNNNLAALFYLVGLAMLPQWFRDGGISIAKFLFWNLSPLILWMTISWLLGHRNVPGYSVLLPRNTRIRFLDSDGKVKQT